MIAKKKVTKHTLCKGGPGVLSKIIEMKKRDVQQTDRFQKASLALGYIYVTQSSSNLDEIAEQEMKGVGESVAGIGCGDIGRFDSYSAPACDGPPAIIYLYLTK